MYGINHQRSMDECCDREISRRETTTDNNSTGDTKHACIPIHSHRRPWTTHQPRPHEYNQTDTFTGGVFQYVRIWCYLLEQQWDRVLGSVGRRKRRASSESPACQLLLRGTIVYSTYGTHKNLPGIYLPTFTNNSWSYICTMAPCTKF